MRSSGFKINKDLHNFIRAIGVTVDNENEPTEVQIISEIRAITNRYQTPESIGNDLLEIYSLEASPQSQEVEAEAA